MPAFEITFAKPRESGEHCVSTSHTLLAMFGIVAVAALLNVYLERLGILITESDPSTFVPVLGPGFNALLPWWNLYLILTFSFCAMLLLQQQWYPPMRWIDLGLTGYAIGLLIGTILAPALIGPTPEWLAELNLPVESMALLQSSVLPLGATLARLVLAVALLILVGRTGKMLGEMGKYLDAST